MDDKLLELRKISYTAGMVYDGALKLCSDALTGDDKDKIKAAAAKQIIAGKDYGVSMAKLLAYVESLEQTETIQQETKYLHKLLDLLDRELEAAERLASLSEQLAALNS